ncbi:MAG: hypothetical protein MPEBLZ_02058 [Candidatus Methanoperedens nitroreducens]|uniref:Uncharacterized protein n=1 Tax=Candidatus Methanoperedens nitratireducens TaxID=1392998 RepID=A0A0P8CK53_9EURY|nr:MAG: hypothetical protein MPEBLZ_02058 [Candidatus Methanoperedens sp. BLZ1]
MGNISVLLLKSFENVLSGSFQGKQYTARIEPNTPCPADSLRLWKQRGFLPSDIGTAFVTFQIINGIKKEYIFPAFFWAE